MPFMSSSLWLLWLWLWGWIWASCYACVCMCANSCDGAGGLGYKFLQIPSGPEPWSPVCHAVRKVSFCLTEKKDAISNCNMYFLVLSAFQVSKGDRCQYNNYLSSLEWLLEACCDCIFPNRSLEPLAWGARLFEIGVVLEKLSKWGFCKYSLVIIKLGTIWTWGK